MDSMCGQWLKTIGVNMPNAHKIRMEQRRLKAAELLLSEPTITYRELAKRLGCSIGTAVKDVKAIRAEWAERRLSAYESRLLEDFIRTDEALAAIWSAVKAGKGWAIDRMCTVLQTRMKLLGLDMIRHEIDIGDVLARYLARMDSEQDDRTAAS
jgi:hypothetical protein